MRNYRTFAELLGRCPVDEGNSPPNLLDVQEVEEYPQSEGTRFHPMGDNLIAPYWNRPLGALACNDDFHRWVLERTLALPTRFTIPLQGAPLAQVDLTTETDELPINSQWVPGWGCHRELFLGVSPSQVFAVVGEDGLPILNGGVAVQVSDVINLADEGESMYDTGPRFPVTAALVAIDKASSGPHFITCPEQSPTFQALGVEPGQLCEIAASGEQVNDGVYVIREVRGNVLYLGPKEQYVFESDVTPANAAATQIRLAASASAENDYYNGYYISITVGTGKGQTRRIIDYVVGGGVKTATIDCPWDVIPAMGDTYLIQAREMDTVFQDAILELRPEDPDFVMGTARVYSRPNCAPVGLDSLYGAPAPVRPALELTPVLPAGVVARVHCAVAKPLRGLDRDALLKYVEEIKLLAAGAQAPKEVTQRLGLPTYLEAGVTVPLSFSADPAGPLCIYMMRPNGQLFFPCALPTGTYASLHVRVHGLIVNTKQVLMTLWRTRGGAAATEVAQATLTGDGTYHDYPLEVELSTADPQEVALGFEYFVELRAAATADMNVLYVNLRRVPG